MIKRKCRCMDVTYRMIREYKFGQLSEDAKKHAIEHFRDNYSYNDIDWEADGTFDYFLDQLKEKGWGDLDLKDLTWEIGSYNGSDHFRFQSHDLDLRKLAKAYGIDEDEYHIRKLAELDNPLSISKDHSISSNWPITTFYDDGDNDTANRWFGCRCMKLPATYVDSISERWINKLADLLDNMYKDECHRIRKELLENYEYYGSDEYITETIECNNYMFDENGDMI